MQKLGKKKKAQERSFRKQRSLKLSLNLLESPRATMEARATHYFKRVFCSIPSRAAIIGDLFSEGSIGNHVHTSFMDNSYTPKCLADFEHSLGIGMHLRRKITPLQNWMNQSGEFHSIGGKNSLGVAMNHVRIVGQVPQAVSVYHDGNITCFALVDHNWDASEHGLVSTKARPWGESRTILSMPSGLELDWW